MTLIERQCNGNWYWYSFRWIYRFYILAIKWKHAFVKRLTLNGFLIETVWFDSKFSTAFVSKAFLFVNLCYRWVLCLARPWPQLLNTFSQDKLCIYWKWNGPQYKCETLLCFVYFVLYNTTISIHAYTVEAVLNQWIMSYFVQGRGSDIAKIGFCNHKRKVPRR